MPTDCPRCCLDYLLEEESHSHEEYCEECGEVYEGQHSCPIDTAIWYASKKP